MNCPYCGKSFGKRQYAFDHVNQYHSRELEQDHLDAAQACWLVTHPTLTGKCNCCPECREVTEWNYATGKPYRISRNPACRARVSKRAEENLMKARGIDQHTLMTDMEHQRDMIRKKHTSGIYRFQCDGGKVEYSSQLDKNWLMFCDKVLELPSFTIQDPPESFQYMDTKENVMRWYTPDYYMPDYNLIVEIKEGGDHPNLNPAYIRETKYKVAMKDEMMKKQTKYNYIRISGTNYGPFVEMLYNIVHQQRDDDVNKQKKNLIVITESACADVELVAADAPPMDIGTEQIDPDKITLAIWYLPNTLIPAMVGITDSEHLAYWLVSDYETQELRHLSTEDLPYPISDAKIYKYIGHGEIMENWYRMMYYQLNEREMKSFIYNDIINCMGASAIFFDDGTGISNNSARKSDFIRIL